MSNASVRISADTANSALAAPLAERLSAQIASTDTDIAIVSTPPEQPATHVVVVGDITDEIDDWDRDVAPQTLAGALWIDPGQDAVLTTAAWWLLRSQTPTTPLSDLTDGNERCLRWSVAGVTAVPLTAPAAVTADPDEIRAELDDCEQIQELGKAIDRVGGDSAELVLQSVETFRQAVSRLDELAVLAPSAPVPAFDTAVAAHLRQVQRSGLGRWRATKARAQSQADLVTAAKEVAADRLRDVIAARQSAQLELRQAQALEAASEQALHRVARAVAEVTLPVVPDFARVPRSWATDAPTPRRYVLIAEQRAEEFTDIADVTVRTSPGIPPAEAWCLVVQSGFSLPALKDS